MCHIASATVRVGTGSCRQCVASAGRTDVLHRHCIESCVESMVCVGSAWRRVASAYIGADDRLTSAAPRFVDFSGWSTTCVIVIATINYELFARGRFVGDTGNCGLVRRLILFNAFHCGYRFSVLIQLLVFDYCIEFCCSMFESCLSIINGFVEA